MAAKSGAGRPAKDFPLHNVRYNSMPWLRAGEDNSPYDAIRQQVAELWARLVEQDYVRARLLDRLEELDAAFAWLLAHGVCGGLSDRRLDGADSSILNLGTALARLSAAGVQVPFPMRFPGVPSAAPAGRDSPLLTLPFRDYDATFWQPQLGPVGYQMLQQASSMLPTPPQSGSSVIQSPPQTGYSPEGIATSLAAGFLTTPAQHQPAQAQKQPLVADKKDVPQTSPSLVVPIEQPSPSHLPSTGNAAPLRTGLDQLCLNQPVANFSVSTEATTPGEMADEQSGDSANSVSWQDDDSDTTPIACSIHTEMKRSRLRPLRALRSNKRKFRCHACTDILEAFVARCGEKPNRPQKNAVLPDIGLNRKQLDFWLANRRRIKKRQRLRRLQREASQLLAKQEPDDAV